MYQCGILGSSLPAHVSSILGWVDSCVKGEEGENVVNSENYNSYYENLITNEPSKFCLSKIFIDKAIERKR